MTNEVYINIQLICTDKMLFLYSIQGAEVSEQMHNTEQSAWVQNITQIIEVGCRGG